jgi:xanthine dehydrogenase accessory factor
MTEFQAQSAIALTLPDWPEFGLLDDVRSPLFAALDHDEPVALATLFRLDGGGPRPVGTQMVFTAAAAHGFLSGGCIEADVTLHAAQVLANGQPKRLVYGPSGPWPDIRLLCGAEIEILLERILPDDLAAQQLRAFSRARTPAVWISNGSARRCVHDQRGEETAWKNAPFEISRAYSPQPRLIIIGSDPAALAMARLGVQTGFETWLNRPKGPQDAPLIPGLHYIRSDPRTALFEIGLDAWTSVAVASHDMDTDHAALTAALTSDAAYVGLLGARRRLSERAVALTAGGLTSEQIGRLHAPIGLDLGGKAPWEVAISVLGQIIQIRQKPPA